MKYEIKVGAYSSLIKTVSKLNDNSGSVYLPRQWTGKEVMIVLLEPLNKEKTDETDNSE